MKAMVGESPNDRNDRGYTFAFLQCFVLLICKALSCFAEVVYRE